MAAAVNCFHCFIISILFFLSFHTDTAFSQRCHPNDKKALLQIRKYLNTPPNSNLISAWDPRTDCCDWNQVVRCDGATNRITIFNLLLADLNRPIPAAVFDLVFLEELYFHETNLTGGIPRAITKLSQLKYLDLSLNHLSGTIPTFLGQLKNLLSIDLSYNKFTGSIPASLSQIPNLNTLFLDRNNLTGGIPATFSNFRQGEFFLYASRNYLSGEIPRKLGEVNFKLIDVSRNMLEGDISFLFGKNKSLIYADFSSNLLQFDFSTVEYFPTSLGTLDLSHNRITGSLPVGLVDLNLDRLNVSYNRLCGQIPVGGQLQGFETTSYLHNKCLCGAPLNKCK
ncbi:hypothetical protein ABFS83_10G172100 [Erythranthe nasuta]